MTSDSWWLIKDHALERCYYDLYVCFRSRSAFSLCKVMRLVKVSSTEVSFRVIWGDLSFKIHITDPWLVRFLLFIGDLSFIIHINDPRLVRFLLFIGDLSFKIHITDPRLVRFLLFIGDLSFKIHINEPWPNRFIDRQMFTNMTSVPMGD